MVNIEGAKKYVGGHWDESGKLQFDFLVSEGLKPNHKFLDVGCGALRGGRFFIDYLDVGNYLGLEKHSWLIDAGNEMFRELLDLKKPTFLMNDYFWLFPELKVNFVLAKSVFTHLTKDKIKQCLNSVSKVLDIDGAFYASFFIGDSSKNPTQSDDTKKFQYSMDEIRAMADGWEITDMGHAGCHRQTMLKFVLK